MPVRSLSSSVLKWPRRAAVEAAARALAQRLARQHPELVRFGIFGSCASGDWGVGSDVDLIAIVARAERPFPERPLDFDLSGLPVPADLVVYTDAEWRALEAAGNPFVRAIAQSAVWLIDGTA